MRIGVRGHDLPATSPEELCRQMEALGVRELQLVAHKSFPNFVYSESAVRELAEVFAAHHIHVAVFGCYIDPLTETGRQRFAEHLRYAKLLNAGHIATESAVGVTDAQENEEVYQALVESFRDFARWGEAAGVRVAVETVSVHPICSPEKTWRLLDDVGSANLDVILDPVNLMHTEDDPNVNEYVKQTLRLYGDRVIAVHWKHPEAKRDDPALVFAARGEQTVVITEGLTDENLSKVIEQLKTI